MNVYWAGTEQLDFVLVGTAVATQTPGSYDTAWIRGNCAVNTGAAAWPMTNYFAPAASFGNLSSFWLHASFYITASNATTLNAIMMALADSGGVARILVRATGTAGQVKLSSRNAAGTITDFTGAVTAAGALPTAVLTKLDLFVNYSSSGQVTLFVNGALAADTGAGVNVTTDSATSLSNVYFSSALNSGSAGYYYSQVIIADSDTRGAGVWLMNSATAGNAQTWSGTPASVNNPGINDASFISAATPGLIEEFKTGGITFPAGAFSVAAVVMSSRALGGSAGGPTRIAYVTRVGSTDYVGGTWTPPVGSFGNNSNYIQATNPGTGLAWTPSDLTAATFNYGIESVA